MVYRGPLGVRYPFTRSDAFHGLHQGRTMMTCSRCSGFMRESLFLDMEGGYGEMCARSWHCLNCGNVHDSVIERNRLAQQEKVLVLPSGRPDDQDNEIHHGPEASIRLAA